MRALSVSHNSIPHVHTRVRTSGSVQSTTASIALEMLRLLMRCEKLEIFKISFAYTSLAKNIKLRRASTHNSSTMVAQGGPRRLAGCASSFPLLPSRNYRLRKRLKLIGSQRLYGAIRLSGMMVGSCRTPWMPTEVAITRHALEKWMELPKRRHCRLKAGCLQTLTPAPASSYR